MKRTELRRVSRRRRKADRERAKLRAVLLEERGAWCQARLLHCDGPWTDLHEIKLRSRGGSITDPANILCVCRSCHTFITDHPKWALKRGFVRNSWDGDAA